MIEETRKRQGVIFIDPALRLTTLRRGAEAEVRKTLYANAAEAGYRPVHGSLLISDASPLAIEIRVRVRDDRTEIPGGHVLAEVRIDEWTGGRPGVNPATTWPFRDWW